MAQKDLFAPPTDDELMAPPAKEELEGDSLFAPPTEDESLFAPPGFDEKSDKDISEAEFEQLSKKYGVPAQELRELAPYYGAVAQPKDLPEALAQGGRAVVGSLGRSVGLGIPQFIYKKLQDPGTRAALDELTERGRAQTSLAQDAAEMVAAPVSLLSKGAGAGARLAEAVGMGTTMGLTSSKEGEELSGAATGLAFGGGVAAGAEVLGKVLQKVGKPNAAEKVVQDSILSRDAVEIDKATQTVLKEKEQSEAIIEDIIQSRKTLDQPQAAVIVKEQLDPETLAKYMDPSTEEGKLIRDKVLKENPDLIKDLGYERAIEQTLAADAVERRARDFAEELTGSRPKTLAEAQDVISKSTEGKAGVQDLYRTFREEKAALEAIDTAGLRGGRGDNFKDKTLNFISDAQFVLRDIDNKLGTSLEPIHQKLNQAYNKMTFTRLDASKQLADIFKKNKKIDDVIVNTDKIYKALDSGNVAGLSPEELRAANDFRNYFDKQLEFVNSSVKSKDPNISPLSIPKRENYVPHMLLEPNDMVAVIERRVEALEKQLGKPLSSFTPKEVAQLESVQEGKELLQALKVFDAKPVKSGPDLSARLKDTFFSSGGRARLDSEARAALERTGNIPEFMREKNLYRLANKWSTNTLRHLYLRDNMNKLGSYAKRLKGAGAELEARYIENLLADINGVRKGTAADLTRNTINKWQRAVDKLEEKSSSKSTKAVATALKTIPEITSDLGKQIYPNLLGLNPKSLVQNAMQPLLKTAPELGGKYGYETVLKGTLLTLKNFNKYVKRAEQLGLMPAEFTTKYSRAIADGIRRNSLYAIPSEQATKLGEVALYLYSKMDILNRAIALGTSDIMARDIAKGTPAVKAAFKKLPNTIKSEINSTKNVEEIADIIGRHLNAATQYNYNRISMSEFGRTMGPLFSIFSKWPTATAGDIIGELRDKGTLKGSLRNLEKYVYPLLMLKAIDYLATEGEGTKEGYSDVTKKFVGGTGLAQAAPLGSIEGIIKGDFFTPPAIDAVMQGLIIPTIEGDTGKLQKGLANALQQWTPGSVYVRFLTDDLVTYLYGSRPEGSDFIERTQEGFNRLTK